MSTVFQEGCSGLDIIADCPCPHMLSHWSTAPCLAKGLASTASLSMKGLCLGELSWPVTPHAIYSQVTPWCHHLNGSRIC